MTCFAKAKMSTINTMPNEILLKILERHSFSLLDLLRISGTCWQWRRITQTSTLLQERLWLRRKQPPKCLQKPRRMTDQSNINVLVRRRPATIWNDYEENMWEMTWCQDEEAKTIPWPRNPIVSNLEDFLHIVNPHFIHQPPYQGCNVRAFADMPLTLCFSGIKDLQAKAHNIDVPMNELWRRMFLSQHCIHKVGIKLDIDIRYGARNFRSIGHVSRECFHEGPKGANNDEVKMQDLVGGMQEGLVLIWQALKEEGLE
jgi:hypothetical protein